MGADVVYNHADYRLVSSQVLEEFSSFKEVNLFLSGMFPLVGFKSTSVYYERHEINPHKRQNLYFRFCLIWIKKRAHPILSYIQYILDSFTNQML